jgi:hypothetical protein
MHATPALEQPERSEPEIVASPDRCTRCRRVLREKARERRFGGWQVLCLDCALDDIACTD